MAMPLKRRAAKRPGKRRTPTLEEQVAQKLRKQQGVIKKEAGAALRILEEKLPSVIRGIKEVQAGGRYVEPSRIRIENIPKFGKAFVGTFPFAIAGRKRNKFVIKLGGLGHESPVVIGVCPLNAAARESSWVDNIAELNLGFEKNAVVIESMQGREGEQASLDRFRQAVGKPAINCMVELVERHAKKCGFKQVKMSRPENLFSYRFPEILEDFPNEEITRYYSAIHEGKLIDFGGKVGARARGIREGMQRLYGAVAKNCGYRLEGDYFVKDL